jgi:hypothetical protein
MKNLLNAIAILAALSGSAEAATIAVTPGSGASLGQAVDGSGNLLAATVICGNPTLVTLYSVCSDQAIVGANGGLGVNILSDSSGNVFQANLFVPNGTVTNTSASTATTTQQFAASGSLSIFLVNYSFLADADDTANPTFQIVVGTGSNCATSQRPLTAVLKAVPGSGIVEGSIGVLNVSDAGDALCVKTTTTQLVSWRIGVVQQ